MTVLRYVVTAASLEGLVEFEERGERAKARYGEHTAESPGTQVGTTLWTTFREGGVNPQSVNHFTLREAEDEQRLVATIVPVLEGAHVVWTVFYRADKAASCFRPLGSRRRIPDALDLALAELAGEIVLPHKP